MSLAELRFKWLLRRGYSIYRYVKVKHSWAGEDPPAFGCYTQVQTYKGLSMKVVTFKKIESPDDLKNMLLKEATK